MNKSCGISLIMQKLIYFLMLSVRLADDCHHIGSISYSSLTSFRRAREGTFISKASTTTVFCGRQKGYTDLSVQTIGIAFTSIEGE